MDQTFGQDSTTRRLYRSRQERMLLGLSGGLARYMEVDPTVVRLGWVVATLATGPGALVAVTHQVNVTALTGAVPSSGEGVVLRRSGGGELVVVGRVRP